MNEKLFHPIEPTTSLYITLIEVVSLYMLQVKAKVTASTFDSFVLYKRLKMRLREAFFF